jgi:hypothetical protein
LKSQINFLKLVYPPISNQEAEWLKNDPDVKEEIRRSNLYMIVQRHESIFKLYSDSENIQNLEEKFIIKFKYIVGELEDDVQIDLSILFKEYAIDMNDFDISIEFGKKQIRIWKCELGTKNKISVIDWFTTEKILWDKSRGHPAISGLNKAKEFSQYYLHYIGISKKDDSLTRLVVKPHDKRLRILSNENNLSFNSRLTDEIILLFFKIEKLEIQILEEQNADDFINGLQIDYDKIIADAEKAFINILESKYNSVKYKNYPKGSDGLYDEGLTRYGYILAEEMTLITDKETICGDSMSEYKFPELADMIFIENDKVTIVKATEST